MLSYFKNKIKFIISLIGRHRWPSNKSHLLILAYHRVLPKNDPRYYFEQPAMVVTPETFEKNLTWAAQHFKLINLNSWLELCKNNNAPKGKYCAITFDDGWIDNLEYALPILKKHNAPATIYCVANMLNNNIDYWPGRVTKLINELSKQPSYINNPCFNWLNNACKQADINWDKPKTEDFSNIIESLKIYKDLEIHNYINTTKQQLNLNYTEERQVLNKDELLSMASTNLIDFGSHTSHHIRFKTDTPSSVLLEEIRDSKERLRLQLNTDIPTFCYPNGYHPQNSVELAKKHYIGACTISSGWNNPNSNFSKLKRIGMHEGVAGDKYSFKALLSGWF